MDKVTIGRIVRFVETDGNEWAAIITVVHNSTLVDLQVFRSNDIVARTSVPLNQPPVADVRGGDDPADITYRGAPFSWHWPARA